MEKWKTAKTAPSHFPTGSTARLSVHELKIKSGQITCYKKRPFSFATDRKEWQERVAGQSVAGLSARSAVGYRLSKVRTCFKHRVSGQKGTSREDPNGLI